MLLMVDGDGRSLTMLLPRLVRSCGRVLHVENPELAPRLCEEHAVDLVVVSAMLPDGGAAALCRALRERGGPPVIAYRVGVDPGAHIRWLDGGGADSLAGDDPVLLAARCRAMLRRRGLPMSGAPLETG